MSKIKKGTALRILQPNEVIQEGDYVMDSLFIEEWVDISEDNKYWLRGHKAKDYKYALARPYPIQNNSI